MLGGSFAGSVLLSARSGYYMPPTDVQPDQLPLLKEFSQRPLSVPRTKTSIAPLVGEVAAGDEVGDPPREIQLDHDVPVHVF